MSAPAVTSARRWREMGVLQTTLVKKIVLAGLYIGIRSATLARIALRGGTSPKP